MDYSTEELEELCGLPINNIKVKELNPDNLYLLEVEARSQEELYSMCKAVGNKIKELNSNIKILIVPVLNGVKSITVKELKGK